MGSVGASPEVDARRGLEAFERGEYDQAIAILIEGLALSHRLGDKAFKCRILNSLGWVYGELYNFEPAIRYKREALEGTRTIFQILRK